MALFVSAPQTGTGVFGVLQQPPSSIAAAGNSTAVVVGQFPWGPINQLVYPGGAPGGTYKQTFAPDGSSRATSSGHLSVIRKAWPKLGVVRALPASAVAATATITSSTPTNILALVAAYPGTQGNSITATTSAASDGNANHFNLLISLSSTSGTTSELYQNLNISGVGADVLPDLSTSVLLASATKSTAGIPKLQSWVFSGGTSPAVTANEYVGTPGGNDFGFALCEQDTTISHLFADDCGASLRPTVNAGLVSHLALTTNKLGYLSGVAGQTAAQAQTDVANYRSQWACYVDPWAYVADDVTGAQQIAPGASWAASVASQIPASLDVGFRAPYMVAMLAGIAKLEAQRGPSARSANTLAGISTLTAIDQGGYSFEGGFNTSGLAGSTDLSSSAMDVYLAKSVATSWAPYVNAPNIDYYQHDLVTGLDAFLGQLVFNADLNPAFLPYVKAYRILSTASSNTANSIAAGGFTVAAQVQYGSQMRQIYFQLQAGVGVTVTVS